MSYLTSYTAPAAADFDARNKTLIEGAVPLVGHEANLLGGLSALGTEGNNEMALTYGLFVGAGSRSWRIRGPNAATPVAPFWSMDDAATTTESTLHQVWVRPSGVAEVALVENTTTTTFANCVALKAADPSAPSGVYHFTISGQQVRVYCDMVTEGGGWMLVLNYVRGGGLNPVLQLRTAAGGFPLRRSTRLGTDESWMRGAASPWGHVDSTSLSKARARGQQPHCAPLRALRAPLGPSAAAGRAPPAMRLRVLTRLPRPPLSPRRRLLCPAGRL